MPGDISERACQGGILTFPCKGIGLLYVSFSNAILFSVRPRGLFKDGRTHLSGLDPSGGPATLPCVDGGSITNAALFQTGPVGWALPTSSVRMGVS